ncbi:hypothetical protein D6C93_07436 [Aureobasidium pullulans]|nr:hypothetical protein D6C93_07436 [Aureobasidium pullulans]
MPLPHPSRPLSSSSQTPVRILDTSSKDKRAAIRRNVTSAVKTPNALPGHQTALLAILRLHANVEFEV